MKTILCFGDSNTYGTDPSTKKRLPRTARWTGVLKAHLGPNFEIIEEGLSKRTTIFNDPVEGKSKNGKHYLLPCLDSHAPLDLVILMLGTSDAKKRLNLSAEDIAAGMKQLVLIAQNPAVGPNNTAPQVLLLPPPPPGPHLAQYTWYEGAEEKLTKLPELYEQISRECSCAFLNIQKYVSASTYDQVHLDAQEHKKLAIAVSAVVSKLLLC